jgi:subtilase family serine protease
MESVRIMRNYLSGSCAAAIICLLPTLASAHSYLRTAPEDPSATGPAACTFPDGTHPSRPEIHCYNPQQFMEAYGIDKLHESKPGKPGLTGKGQTIILVDAFGSPTAQADLDIFSDTYSLPRKNIHFIYPNGIYVNPLTMADPKDPTKQVADPDKIGWAGETTLDLQWAHAIAPDAEIVNIVTNVTETEGTQGLPELFNGIEMAAKKYPNGIVSMSFGTGEPTFTGQEIDDNMKGSFHDIFTEATRAGMTLLAATGDNGTASAGLETNLMMDIPATGYPASDPLITAVGGTALEYGWKWDPKGSISDYMDCKSRQSQEKKANPDAKLADCPLDLMNSQEIAGSRIETVWKEDWALAAGGGGVSSVFDLPDYQGSLPASVKATLDGHRAIPDIAMNAAINGGVIMYTGYQIPGATKAGPVWTSSGGTSAATPETAAMIALAGQRASDLMGKQVGIGSLNRILYTLGSEDFHDIVPQSFGAQNQVVIDSNALYFSDLALQVFGPGSETPVQVPGYSAMPGYDLASGLGSPVAERLVEDVAQARASEERRVVLP